MSDNTKSCLAFAIVFTFLILSVTLAIMQKVYAYDSSSIRQPTWSPPAIEQCEKELWLRIKDGCTWPK